MTSDKKTTLDRRAEAVLVLVHLFLGLHISDCQRSHNQHSDICFSGLALWSGRHFNGTPLLNAAK